MLGTLGGLRPEERPSNPTHQPCEPARCPSLTERHQGVWEAAWGLILAGTQQDQEWDGAMPGNPHRAVAGKWTLLSTSSNPSCPLRPVPASVLSPPLPSSLPLVPLCLSPQVQSPSSHPRCRLDTQPALASALTPSSSPSPP